MSGVDVEVVATRLATIRDLTDYLGGLGEVTARELRGDVERRLAVERALSQLVDQATDINAHIATRLLGRPPMTGCESFELVARCGYLSDDLSAAIAASVGLRNLLVHEYSDIDLTRVAASVPVAAEQYRSYVREVSSALLAHRPHS